jgi:K(+)-stimulated pyrophosphate-energized sodium pump
VGDPFKDTSGPSMNILIKLTCLIGLVVAPILGGHSQDETVVVNNEVEVKVSVDQDQSDQVVATIKYVTTENGSETIVEKTFSGTDSEVTQQLEDFEVAISESSDSSKKVIKKVEITKE